MRSFIRRVKRYFENKFSSKRRKLVHYMTEKNLNNLKWVMELQKTNAFRVIEVELIRRRPFYDSKWIVYFMDGGQLATAKVVTRSSSTKENLYKRLSDTQNKSEILSLDQRDKIYYD